MISCHTPPARGSNSLVVRCVPHSHLSPSAQVYVPCPCIWPSRHSPSYLPPHPTTTPRGPQPSNHRPSPSVTATRRVMMKFYCSENMTKQIGSTLIGYTQAGARRRRPRHALACSLATRPRRAAATCWWCAACRTLTCPRRPRFSCPARAACRRATRPRTCHHTPPQPPEVPNPATTAPPSQSPPHAA